MTRQYITTSVIVRNITHIKILKNTTLITVLVTTQSIDIGNTANVKHAVILSTSFLILDVKLPAVGIIT